MPTAKDLINEIFTEAGRDSELQAQVLAAIKALYDSNDLSKKKIGEVLTGLRGGNNG